VEDKSYVGLHASVGM